MPRILLVFALVIFSVIFSFAQIEFEEHLFHNGNAHVLGGVEIEYGDIDGDGDLDLLSVSSEDGIIAYYPNDNNLFTDKVVLLEDVSGLLDAEIVDLDQDGDMDVVYVVENDQVKILENSGLDFMNHSLLPDPIESIDSPKEVEIADLNNDGYKEVVVLLENGNVFVVWNSTTGFNSEVNIIKTSPYESIEVADMNGDGYFEIIGVGYFLIEIVSFESMTEYNVYDEGDLNVLPGQISIGDINNDDLLDVVVLIGDTSGLVENQYSVLLSLSENKYVLSHHNNLGPVMSTASILLDIDQDGYVDLCYVNSYYKKLAFLKGGGGVFGQEELLFGIGAGVTDFIITDLDNDSLNELVLLSDLYSSISLYNINDELGYSSDMAVGVKYVAPTNVMRIDLDGDDCDEILVSYYLFPELEVYKYVDDEYEISDFLLENLELTVDFVELKTPDGKQLFATMKDETGLIKFHSSLEVNGVVNTFDLDTTYLSSIQFEDALNNGSLDLIVSDSTNSILSLVSYGWSDDFFELEVESEMFLTSISPSDKIARAEFEDVDGDSDLDILVYTERDSLLYLENVNKEYYKGLKLLTNKKVLTYEVLDFLNDGTIDVLVGDYVNDEVFYLTVNDNGDITYNEYYDSHFSATGLISGDINDDGHLDLVVRVFSNAFRVLLFDVASASYVESDLELTTASSISGGFLIDMDKDGDLDILHYGFCRSSLAWYESNLLTNIDEVRVDPNVIISPNPTSNYAWIESSINYEQISLYDSQGRFIRNVNENKIDVSDLLRGIYFIHFVSGDGVLVRPIVVE